MIPQYQSGIRPAKIWTLLLMCAALLCFSTIGCGGGSGGSSEPGTPETDNLSYSGPNTPALISEENANTIAANALESRGSANGFSAFSSDTTSVEPSPLMLSGIAMALKAALVPANPVNFAISDMSSELKTADTHTRQGSCGGSVTSITESNGESGRTTGSMTFNDYCEGGTTINGQTTYLSDVNRDGDIWISSTLTFNRLTATSAGHSITMNGRIESVYTETSLMMTMDMVISDNYSNTVCKIEDYQLTIIHGEGDMKIEISGRFYDSEHGYVDIDTPSPLTYEGASIYPYSGVMELTGETGSAGGYTMIRLTAISATECRLEADTNGDGSFDYDTGVILWTELCSNT